MRFDTTLTKHHSFEYWRPIITLDANGEETLRVEFDGMHDGMFMPSAGSAFLIATKHFEMDGEIRALTDRKGNNLFSVGVEDFEFVMFVAQVEPIVDPRGILIGYKHSLRRSAGVD